MEIIPLCRLASRHDLEKFKGRAADALLSLAGVVDLESASKVLSDKVSEINSELLAGNAVMASLSIREALAVSAAAEAPAKKPEQELAELRPELSKTIRSLSGSSSLLVPPEYFVLKQELGGSPKDMEQEAEKLLASYYPDVAEKMNFVNSKLDEVKSSYKDVEVVFPKIKASEIFDAAFKTWATLKSYLIDGDQLEFLAESSGLSDDEIFDRLQKTDLNPETSGAYDDYLARRMGSMAIESAESLSDLLAKYGSLPGVTEHLDASLKKPEVQALVKELFATPPASIADLAAQMNAVASWRDAKTIPGNINPALVPETQKTEWTGTAYETRPLSAVEYRDRLVSSLKQAFSLYNDIQTHLLSAPAVESETASAPVYDIVSDAIGRNALTNLRKEAAESQRQAATTGDAESAKTELDLLNEFVRSHGKDAGEAQQLLGTLSKLESRAGALDALYSRARENTISAQTAKDINDFAAANADAFYSVIGPDATSSQREKSSKDILAWMSAAVEEAPYVLVNNVRDYVRLLREHGSKAFGETTISKSLADAVSNKNIADIIEVLSALQEKAPKRAGKDKTDSDIIKRVAEDRLEHGGYYNSAEAGSKVEGVREFLRDLVTARPDMFVLDGEAIDPSPEAVSRGSFELLQEVYENEKAAGKSAEEADALANAAWNNHFAAVDAALDSAVKAAGPEAEKEWEALRPVYDDLQAHATAALNAMAAAAHKLGVSRDSLLDNVYTGAARLAATNPDLSRKDALSEALADLPIDLSEADEDAALAAIDKMLPQYGIGLHPRSRSILGAEVGEVEDAFTDVERLTGRGETEPEGEAAAEDEEAAEESEASDFSPYSVLSDLANKYNAVRFYRLPKKDSEAYKISPARMFDELLTDLRHEYNSVMNTMGDKPVKQMALDAAIDAIFNRMAETDGKQHGSVTPLRRFDAEREIAKKLFTPESVETKQFVMDAPAAAAAEKIWLSEYTDPVEKQRESLEKEKQELQTAYEKLAKSLTEANAPDSEWARADELKAKLDKIDGELAKAEQLSQFTPEMQSIFEKEREKEPSKHMRQRDALSEYKLGKLLVDTEAPVAAGLRAGELAAKLGELRKDKDFMDVAGQSNLQERVNSAIGDALKNLSSAHRRALEAAEARNSAASLVGKAGDKVSAELLDTVRGINRILSDKNVSLIDSDYHAALNALNIGDQSEESSALSSFLRSYINE